MHKNFQIFKCRRGGSVNFRGGSCPQAPPVAPSLHSAARNKTTIKNQRSKRRFVILIQLHNAYFEYFRVSLLELPLNYQWALQADSHSHGGFKPVSPVSVHRSGFQTKERMTLFIKIFRKIKKSHAFLRFSSQSKSGNEMSLKA